MIFLRKDYLRLALASLVGFLTFAWIGLFLSPLVLFLISRINSKNLRRDKWLWWFVFGFLINFLYQFDLITNSIQYDPIVSGVKNQLVNGFKECIVREADNLSINYSDVESFKGNRYFKIQKINDSCYAARAVQFKSRELDILNHRLFKKIGPYPSFEINMNAASGNVTKSCSDPSLIGCKEDKKW